MSNTRYAKEGSGQSDERYASDPLLSKGLKAGDVVRRCETLEAPEQIELALFLQYVSNLPGGLEKLARNLLVAFPDRLGTPKMRELGTSREVYKDFHVRIIRQESHRLFGHDEFILRGEERVSSNDFVSFDSDDLLGEAWSPRCTARRNARKEELAIRQRQRAEESQTFPDSYPVAAFLDLCRECFLEGALALIRRFCLDPSFGLSNVVVTANEFATPVFYDLPGALLAYLDLWEKLTLSSLRHTNWSTGN